MYRPAGSLTVRRVYKEIDGSNARQHVTSITTWNQSGVTWDQAGAVWDYPVGTIALEFVTDFNKDGGVAVFLDEDPYIDEVFYYSGIDEENDLLTGVVRPNVTRHSPQVFVQAGEKPRTEVFADGWIDDNPMVTKGVLIPGELVPYLPEGIRDEGTEIVPLVQGPDHSLRVAGAPVGELPVVDMSFADPYTIPIPILTDQVPPASSPTPIVTGGIGSLLVRWAAMLNDSPVTYEVHISTTSGFTPTGATKAGEVQGTVFPIRKMPDGSSLDYITTYYVKLIAFDADGYAPESAQASGTLVQVTGPDIAVNQVTADHIVVNDLLAQSIISLVMQASLFRTADSGQRVEINASGITLFDSTNNPIISIPTDSGTDAYVRAAIDAVTLNVLQGVVMKGTQNILESGGILTLRSGIRASVSKPSLKVVWPDRVNLPSETDGQGNPASAQHFYYRSNGYGSQPTFLISWNGKNSAGVPSVMLAEYKTSDMTKLRTIQNWVWGLSQGIAVAGTAIYLLVSFLWSYTLNKYSDSTGAFTVSRNITDDFKYGTDADGNPINFGGYFLAGDGTLLYIFSVQGTSSWQALWRYNTVTLSDAGAWTKSAATNLATTTANIFTQKSWMVAESRVWVSLIDDYVQGTVVTSWDLSGVASPNYDFTGPSSILALTYDGIVFRSLTKSQIISHSLWKWTTDSGKYWVGFTWHEDIGPTPSGTWTGADYESQESPVASINMVRRAKLAVTIPQFPSPVSAGGIVYASLYMHRGATDPGSHKRQGFGGTSTTQVIATFDTAGALRAAAGEGAFPTGANAALQTEDGNPLIRANGLSRIRIANTTATSRANATAINPSFGAGPAEIDTDAYWSSGTPSQFTVPFSGSYLIIARCTWAPNAVGTRKLVVQRLVFGGAWTDLEALRDNRVAVAGSVTTTQVSNFVTLGALDSLRFEIFQDSGAALNANAIHMSIIFLGPS